MNFLYKNLGWAVAILLLIAAFSTMLVGFQPQIPSISLNVLAERISKGEVAKVTARADTLEIEFRDGSRGVSQKESEAGLSETLTNYGVTPEALRAVAIDIRSESAARLWLGVLIPTLLPILIIAVFVYFILKQARGGANQVFSFGKSNVKLSSPLKDKITFKDVAGLKEAKQELEEVVDFLKNPKKFLDLGAKIPRGVLMVGPPGSGKTLLARAVSGESGVPFFHISASEFVEMFVGVGASRTRDSFATAKKSAPSILFIDEIDAIGRERGAGLGGGHDEREQTLNQILVEMDGFDRDTKVIVVAASVTGDTPVLIKQRGEYQLKPIAEVIDPYYRTGEENIEKEINEDFTVLGFTSASRGPSYFQSAAFKSVRSVFRHHVSEIYEIEYLGGKLRTTGNHSVFVRGHGGVKPKPVSELTPGDILTDLPYQANRTNKDKRELRGYLFAPSFDRTLPVWQPLFARFAPVAAAYAQALAAAGKFSQAHLGAQLGFSQATIGKWQRGISGPRELSRSYYQHQWVLPETIRVTPDLMRLFGYYTAEGYSRKELDFCFHERETDKVSDVKTLMRSIFGVDPDRERHITENAINVVYHAKPLAAFFAHHCGQGAHRKHVPQFLFEAPREYFVEFLRGYFGGDGYRDKRGRIEITSVSKRLILELNWLARMHGYKSFVHSFTVPAGRQIKGGKPLAATVAWRIGFGRTQDPLGTRVGKASIKRPIVRSVTKLPYDGYVYDFCGCENEAFFGGNSPILLHNTNRPDILDPALLRPGRFDRRIVLDYPDIKDREEILKIHAKGKPLDADVNLHKVAVRTPGFSGADIANLINEAAILAARNNRKTVLQEDFYEAVEKVMLGPERRGRVISDREKKITAYHEAGHALVTASIADADPVHKVSIVSRGRTGGYTLKLPSEDVRLKTKSQFLGDLAIMLGGYSAEQSVFGDISTGASNDLKEASELSRNLVTKFGMSQLGPITFGSGEEAIFLGREIAAPRNYSEKVAAQIDHEVQRFIAIAHSTAKKIIESRRKVLEAIAETLMQKETLEQEEFYAILKPFNLRPVTVG